MAFELSNISMPMAALLASLIGASATITAAILNLRMTWKRELMLRAQQKPVTKKSSSAPIVPIMVLLLASAAGGFALSYYMEGKEETSADLMEAELRTLIEQLDAAIQRLETASVNGETDIAQRVQDDERRKRGMQGVVAGVVLEKCTAAPLEGEASCTESTAHPLQLCTEIPPDANIVAIDLYARPEGDWRPWREHRVLPGDYFSGGRFLEGTTESLLDDTSKQVCQPLLHWNSDHRINGRMIVRYDPPPLTADGETPPTSDERAYRSLNQAISQVP